MSIFILSLVHSHGFFLDLPVPKAYKTNNEPVGLFFRIKLF